MRTDGPPRGASGAASIWTTLEMLGHFWDLGLTRAGRRESVSMERLAIVWPGMGVREKDWEKDREDCWGTEDCFKT